MQQSDLAKRKRKRNGPTPSLSLLSLSRQSGSERVIGKEIHSSAPRNFPRLGTRVAGAVVGQKAQCYPRPCTGSTASSSMRSRCATPTSTSCAARLARLAVLDLPWRRRHTVGAEVPLDHGEVLGDFLRSVEQTGLRILIALLLPVAFGLQPGLVLAAHFDDIGEIVRSRRVGVRVLLEHEVGLVLALTI